MDDFEFLVIALVLGMSILVIGVSDIMGLSFYLCQTICFLVIALVIGVIAWVLRMRG